MRDEVYVRHGHTAAFTLVELLIVIAIIGILAALVLTAVHKSREKGRQANCMSNLHQISLAIILHQDDHQEQFPPWLSALFPRYLPLGRPEILICKSDASRGADGSKPGTSTHPNQEYLHESNDTDQFEETDDTASNTHSNRNMAIKACSYMYECCAAECVGWTTWPDYLDATLAQVDKNGDGHASWGEVKEYQLKHGDDTNGHTPYDPTLFPIVRCFHHYKERKFDVVDQQGQSVRQCLTLNVAYAGNLFQAPLHWELLRGQ